ncbi:MAG: hypothetical protein WA919_14380 [Coleofasciculaceae cyanobacterium]
MKLEELKERVYEAWEALSTYNSALVQPENFLKDVRGFGDLRFKATWLQAYAAFVARNIFDSNSDNRTLITVQLYFSPSRWDWQLRQKILEQFLAIPEGWDCIINGLEQVFSYPLSKEEQEKAYGVFELVQKQSGGSARVATGFVQQLVGADSTRAG